MVKFNKITRDGYSISVQHFPQYKRPVLCVEFPDKNTLIKVGEITNEVCLIVALVNMFRDAKVVEE